MRRYSIELKLKAIEDWRKREISIVEIIKKYSISTQTLNKWIAEYDSQGLDGLIRKSQNKVHTGGFKQAVVEDMGKSGLSQSEEGKYKSRSESISKKVRKYCTLKNSVMENFFSLLESELLYLQDFFSLEQFKEELEEYIDFYNNRRIMQKLKGLSPVQYSIQSSISA